MGAETSYTAPPQFYYDSKNQDLQLHQVTFDEWGDRTIRIWHHRGVLPSQINQVRAEILSGRIASSTSRVTTGPLYGPKPDQRQVKGKRQPQQQTEPQQQQISKEDAEKAKLKKEEARKKKEEERLLQEEEALRRKQEEEEKRKLKELEEAEKTKQEEEEKRKREEKRLLKEKEESEKEKVKEEKKEVVESDSSQKVFNLNALSTPKVKGYDAFDDL